MLFVIGAIAFNPSVSQAKANDDQTQIILLNDSAAALEDSDPGLSKSLTKLADEKEKGKIILPLQEQIKLLKAAALAIGPTYPLIAQALKKMANGINKTDIPYSLLGGPNPQADGQREK